MFTCIAFSQVTVYKTYLDYTSNQGIEYTTLEYATSVKAKFKIEVVSGNEKTTYLGKDIYGFELDGYLYRTINRTAVKMQHSDKVCYYVDARPTLAKKTGASYFTHQSIQCYISKDEGSPLVEVWFKGNFKSNLKKFGEENPDYQALIDCIMENANKGYGRNDGHNPQYIKPCVKTFDDGWSSGKKSE